MASDPHNKKFLFNLNNFDETSEDEKKKKKPPEPTFSLQDMEAARESAFEKGKQEGMQAAKDSIEQRTEILIQSIAGNITTLEQQEEKRKEQFAQDSLIMVYQALHSVFPTLLEKTADEEIKTFLSEFFKQTTHKSGFALSIHSDMKDAIAPHATKIHANISIENDDSLSPSMARIEWANGVAEWNPEKTAENILNLIRPYIHNSSELLDESAKKPHNERDSVKEDNTSIENEDS